jgi:uncharacterized protein YqhQ
MDKPHIGGQAVIEGVMIRNRYVYSIAVRKPDGSIEVTKKALKSPAQRYKILRSPFVRGVTALVENLILGLKSLLYSAEVALPEEGGSAQTGENKSGKPKSGARGSSGMLLTLGLIPAVLLGVALFMILPNLSTHYLGVVEKDSPFLFNIIAGVIRLCVFILYIVVISFMRDIRRTFQYHGAEHKTIFCYESDKPLTVGEVNCFKTMHPRCGTSFLFFVFFITILVFPLITVSLRVLYPGFIDQPLPFRKLITLTLHIFIALPVIASVSYELLKLSDRFQDNLLMKILIAPGLLLQKITTKDPDDGQLEVAIEAVKAVL